MDNCSDNPVEKASAEKNILNFDGMNTERLCIWRRLNQILLFPAKLEVAEGFFACFALEGKILKVFFPGSYDIDDRIVELKDVIHSEASSRLRLYFLALGDFKLNFQILCWLFHVECSVTDPVKVYGTYIQKDLQLTSRDVGEDLSGQIRADLVSSLGGEFVLEQKAEYLEKVLSELPSYERLGLSCNKIEIQRIEKYGPSVSWSEEADKVAAHFENDHGKGEFLVVSRSEAHAIRFERMGPPRTEICGFAALNHSDKYFRFNTDSEQLGIAIDTCENEKLSLFKTELSAYKRYDLRKRSGSSSIILTPNKMEFLYAEPVYDAAIYYEIGWWKSFEEFSLYIKKRLKEENKKHKEEKIQGLKRNFFSAVRIIKKRRK